MSIHVVLGKPGSGKSLYGTSRGILEFKEGTRNIVTNLPLRPDRLNEYLQGKYPTVDCRMVQRLRLLTDDEIPFFWKFRSPEDVAPPELYQLPQEQDDKRREAMMRSLNAWSKTPTASDQGKGVMYILDEAHIAFNARKWAQLGDAALFYLSQHRKLGDQVWVITQAPGNLDK